MERYGGGNTTEKVWPSKYFYLEMSQVGGERQTFITQFYFVTTIFWAFMQGMITLSQTPKTTNLDFSKPKEFADDRFKFDEIGRKFPKKIENSMEKREIALYEQFLLFLQC